MRGRCRVRSPSRGRRMTRWLAAVTLLSAVVWSGRPPRGLRLAPQAPVPASAADRAGWVVAAVAGSAIVVVGVSTVGFFIVAGAALGAQRLVRRRRLARRREETALAVVEVTYALAAELRAGRTPAEALLAVTDMAGPLAPALHSAYRAVVVGANAADELATAAAMPGAERLRAVAAAWAVATSAGGQIAVVLERLSVAMDEEAELRRELDAALAGPRATMALLAGLPVFGLVLGQSVGAHPVRLLLHRPLGWGLLAGAAILDAAGVLIMRAIVMRAQAP
jgi:tight adherence protein B